MDYLKKIISEIEMHSVEGIKDCFENGIDPNSIYRGEPLINELTSEYLRGPRFKRCIRTFIEYGLEFSDQILLEVWSDNASALEKLVKDNPELIKERRTLRCAYTPMHEVTLLHICAEFNHFESAKILIENGADVNAISGKDEYGFGGQTPIFHTVNQNLNQSAEMMDLLLERGADLKITVPGLIWGKSYEWETLIPCVNPISYAMMGLLPQMHRNEKTVADVVSRLLKVAYDIDYYPANIPNQYLAN